MMKTPSWPVSRTSPTNATITVLTSVIILSTQTIYAVFAGVDELKNKGIKCISAGGGNLGLWDLEVATLTIRNPHSIAVPACNKISIIHTVIGAISIVVDLGHGHGVLEITGDAIHQSHHHASNPKFNKFAAHKKQVLCIPIVNIIIYGVSDISLRNLNNTNVTFLYPLCAKPTVRDDDDCLIYGGFHCSLVKKSDWKFQRRNRN